MSGASEEYEREELAILFLVEPRALDVEKPEAGNAAGERERVDGELSDRLVGAGVRLVVEHVHGTIAHLKEIDMASNCDAGRDPTASQYLKTILDPVMKVDDL